MNAYAWRDHARDRIIVHLEHGPGHWVTRDGRVTKVEGGDVRPAFLELDPREAHAIVQAIGQELPWGDEAREALADTRKVRDRLLTMLEQLVPE